MATAFISHTDCLDHVTPIGHPEQVARLQTIQDALSASQFDNLLRLDAPLAKYSEILRCHPAEYISKIRAGIPKDGHASLDADTHLSPGSLNAGLRAVGGNLKAVDLVLGGEASNAFVACRPPGHHAETSRAMGFCMFGNVSIAAKYALDHHGLNHVAIIDFDVHHGNGTQDLLWDEARTLFCSSHEMPLFPGTGDVAETGAHGNILNVPFDANSNGHTMRQIYSDLVFPAISEFDPDLILISAGFDAHGQDPLASLTWETDDFAWLTRNICRLADGLCNGRVVSSLEGGYDLPALGQCAAAHVQELMEIG